MNSILIMGASSGIGYEVAKIFIAKGMKVGVAARRKDKLEELKVLAPDRVYTKAIDITVEDSSRQIMELIDEMGGMDTYFHVSGIGKVNREMDMETEMKTMETNCLGWTRCIVTAYNYLKGQKGGGQIAIVSSVAGTKGLGPAPSYSASKRMQSNYIQALAQKANADKVKIRFTDIRPGFVDTPLLDGNNKFPLMLELEYAAKKIAEAVEKGKRNAIIDWKYKMIVGLWKMIPNCIWEKMPLRVGRRE